MSGRPCEVCDKIGMCSEAEMQAEPGCPFKAKRGDLGFGEPHPMSFAVRDYISKWTHQELLTAREVMASCAIEGNRAAEICGETLNRLLQGLPVSDRYIMGLGWFLKTIEEGK